MTARPAWNIPQEMHDVRQAGLAIVLLLSVIACAFFGPWPVLAYYGAGIAVSFAKCLFRSKRFIHPLNGAVELQRLYRYAIIVVVLWPFVLLQAIGLA